MPYQPRAYPAENTEDSFWPSFTDVMMVILMIFMLVVIAVILSNTRLMDQLRNSLMAEQEASQLVEFTLQENATLEEQLEYYKRRVAATEMELLQTKAQQEDTQQQLLSARTDLSHLRDEERQQQALLTQRSAQIDSLRADLGEQRGEVRQLQQQLAELQRTSSDEAQRLQSELSLAQESLQQAQRESSERKTLVSALREQMESSQQRLASLEGDYAELDQKYQKLVKPSRSAKNKTVVEVMYQRSGYRIRAPGQNKYRHISYSVLETELSGLKEQYGNDLYVKIIIPKNSGLSYNEAWRFTSDMLNKYDYYYQQDNSLPAVEENEN